MNVEKLIKLLPIELLRYIELDKLKYLKEIRLRVNRKTALRYIDCEKIVDFIPNEKNMISLLQMLCENSIYSYQSQICNGFITLYGGHRVGIMGSCSVKDGKVNNVNYISSLNFRISKEIIGACNDVLKFVITNNQINNTLIVSKPGCGKTTVLRDLIRVISNIGFNVSVIDERGEIAAMYKGVPQNDVGLRTDVMDNVSKSIGMKIAIRTMAPDVIFADEIGTQGDLEAINYGVCSGVKGIFTAHASTIDELLKNINLKKLYDEKIFKKLIFLEREGKVKNIYTLEDNLYKLEDENIS